MEKIDARKLPSAALEEKRRLSVKLRKEGMTRAQIGEVVGVHPDTVGRWLKAYEAQGAKALKSQVRGRRKGVCRRLDMEQEDRIQKLLIDKTPDQLKLPYALWTRESVKELIKAQLGIDLPIRTVGHYLKRWGMTPQKPVKRAYEQQPARVRQWLDEEYPQIQAKAKAEGAEIYWGDETGLRNDSQHERGYAPKGKTPVIRLNAKRESINMISAITNQGKVRFKLFDGGMNAAILIDFLKRLIKDAQRKVILIVDNLRVHHAKKVKEWLQGKEDQIELFYLPAYSPELNPDEYLNCDLKAGVHSGPPARSKGQLKKKVISHMRMLQKKSARVKKYFKHEKIRYAA
ncbi:MAG: IS630 family transposase [Candidatus Thiodiazotropha endolucinida]|nr:IS630 family transposase [Candidatus Thiodiazotropha taylori]MCG8065957.1 IS630 family transposase [Candidatus Thiodiazotropha taylori]MCW4305964.1 IS630 family transposase [Candidatus Thiodiazotropha taylori]MCW4332053.1 IS630 family transposase [Candidatus Thiodiazotropha endolucinida]